MLTPLKKKLDSEVEDRSVGHFGEAWAGEYQQAEPRRKVWAVPYFLHLVFLSALLLLGEL